MIKPLLPKLERQKAKYRKVLEQTSVLQAAKFLKDEGIITKEDYDHILELWEVPFD